MHRLLCAGKTVPEIMAIRTYKEPSPSTLLDGCDELALRRNITVAIEEIFSGHAYVVKRKLGVVHTVQTHLVAHVLHGHAINELETIKLVLYGSISKMPQPEVVLISCFPRSHLRLNCRLCI